MEIALKGQSLSSIFWRLTFRCGDRSPEVDFGSLDMDMGLRSSILGAWVGIRVESKYIRFLFALCVGNEKCNTNLLELDNIYKGRDLKGAQPYRVWPREFDYAHWPSWDWPHLDILEIGLGRSALIGWWGCSAF